MARVRRDLEPLDPPRMTRVVAVIEFPEEVTLEMARDRLMFVNRGTLGIPDVSAWIRSVELSEEES